MLFLSSSAKDQNLVLKFLCLGSKCCSSDKDQNVVLKFLWRGSKCCSWLEALAHWAETHFGWLCFLICGSGWMSLGSSGSQSRPSDKDFGKPVFKWHTLRSVLLAPQGMSPQTLTLSGRARFIAWNLRHPFLGESWWGSRHFWNHKACVGYGPATGVP